MGVNIIHPRGNCRTMVDALNFFLRNYETCTELYFLQKNHIG